MRECSCDRLVRALVRSRRSRISNRGMKLPRSSPCLQKFRDPLTVLRVRLASGNRLDVLGVCQNNLKMTFENVPHRLPINARGFHRHVLNAKLVQPHDQLSKLAGGAPEAANLLQRFAGLRYQDASSDGGLMHIQSAALWIQNFHGCLLPPREVRMHKSRKSPSRAPLRREGDSLLFSTASRVKLIRGLSGSIKADDHVRPPP